MPLWWNGIHASFKNWSSSGHIGSNPIRGTKFRLNIITPCEGVPRNRSRLQTTQSNNYMAIYSNKTPQGKTCMIKDVNVKPVSNVWQY